GYVGVGIVTGTPASARDFKVMVDGRQVPITEVPLNATNLAATAALEDDETEWFVRISWIKTVPAQEAIGFKGRYGNQNSATNLTHTLTRATVLERLGINEDNLDGPETVAEG